MERASGNALQAWTKGLYDTMAALPSGLSSPKNPALSQRLAVIVSKIGRKDQYIGEWGAQKVWGAFEFSRPGSVTNLRLAAKLSGNTRRFCWRRLALEVDA